MKIIIGLGNVGDDYDKTRHNAGFVLVERLAKKLGGGVFKTESKFKSEVLRIGDLILVKPTTYMNDSGMAVRKVMEFYKSTVDDVVVAHDDLDLRLGEYKFKKGVGPKIHNGINSVEKNLGSDGFFRIRLGIDGRLPGIRYGSGADYVLSKFKKEEMPKLEMAMDLALGDLAVAFGLEFE